MSPWINSSFPNAIDCETMKMLSTIQNASWQRCCAKLLRNSCKVLSNSIYYNYVKISIGWKVFVLSLFSSHSHIIWTRNYLLQWWYYTEMNIQNDTNIYVQWKFLKLCYSLSVYIKTAEWFMFTITIPWNCTASAPLIADRCHSGFMYLCRAIANSPVLARPLFLKVNTNFISTTKAVINKSASVIFGLINVQIYWLPTRYSKRQ